jgi:7-cyano-7-deazaguanine synthase in queuosine biosynthesis
MGQAAGDRPSLVGGAVTPAGKRRTVVLDERLPGDTFDQYPQFKTPDLRLRLNGSGHSVLLDLPHISRDLRCHLPPRVRDLLEIAATVYAAEAALNRAERAHGPRFRDFLVPVREPDFWRAQEPWLAEFLYVLSKGSYVFRFCERRPVDGEYEPGGERADWEGTDCVALLSGGLDSFAGATALLASDRRPLFVLHHPDNPAVLAAQEHVLSCLSSRFRSKVRWVAARCGLARPARDLRSPSASRVPPDPEPTRALLHLSLGAAACHATGARRLLYPRTGLLALAPSLEAEPDRDDCSQTGIPPRALSPFSHLLAAVGVPAKLENPLIYQTKGQLVRDWLRPSFSATEIQGSVSCWSAGKTSRPCGACIPCLIRAIAMRINELPHEAHLVDPLGTGGTTGLGGRVRGNLCRLMSLIERLRSLSDEQLPYAYPALLDLPPEGSIRLASGMLRHFAHEAAQVVYS